MSLKEFKILSKLGKLLNLFSDLSKEKELTAVSIKCREIPISRSML